MRLTEYLQKEGLSEQEFCALANIAPSELARLKSGNIRSQAWVERIAKATNYEVTRLSEMRKPKFKVFICDCSDEMLSALAQLSEDVSVAKSVYESRKSFGERFGEKYRMSITLEIEKEEAAPK